MGIFTVYLPMDRRQALARNVELPDRARGAVLFADISGFTPLTETLARHFGPQRGAEQVTHQLNSVYGALIAEVHGYSGSIINFSGDAITCWFDDDTAMAGNASHRAAACALAMQRVMRPFATIITENNIVISLALKVAVTAGPVRRFLVGRPDVQVIEVLAGQTLDRVAAAEHLVNQGEVIVGAEIIAAVGSQILVAAWRETENGERFAVVAGLTPFPPPQPWPAAPDVSSDIARKWLLPPVYQRLERGEGGFVSGLRPAVALFVRFSGLDYDADDGAGIKLDGFIRWVQAALTRYEGVLLQLTIGDKGSYFYAVFGAPLAHEDDPIRAAAAALALQSLPAELAFIGRVQIGISQGQMYTGAYGGPTRQTYGVLGNEANVAARLMTRATPGQILATKRIAQAAAHSYVFQELDAIPLKGLARPLPLFMLLGEQHRPADGGIKRRSLTAMVGREAERAILGQQLEALRPGRSSHCLIIEGEAGIGKSRVIADLLAQAQALQVNYAVTTTDAIEKSTPYHAWRSIFRQLFNLDAPLEDADAETRHQWRARVLNRLEEIDPALLRLAPLLTVVLPLYIPDNELTAQMDGQVRADNTHELLVSVLRAATAAMPLLLVLEDVHWLDSASWALAQLAGRDVPSLLLVLTTRPLAEPPAEYTYLYDRPNALHLKLDTLPAPAIETLVCQRLGVSSLPEAIATLIQQKAEGHPFFSEELAYALRDSGLIEISEGVCRIAPHAGELRALDFPDTIQGVIISRLDRLPSQQQVALKVASVIGRIFAFRILRDIHPIETDKSHLYEYLVNLDRLDITPLEAPEPDLAYIFKHVITQEVSYNMLLFTQRYELHRTVAEWYERTYAGDLSPFYSLLAHHWRQAVGTRPAGPEIVMKAIDYLEKAGEQARISNANQEAIAFFNEALALDQQVEPRNDRLRRARWESQISNACLGLGQFDESRRHAEKALALLGYTLPTGRRGLVTSLIGQVGQQIRYRLKPVKTRAVVRDKRELPYDDAVKLEAAWVFTLLSHLFYFANDTGLLLHAILCALNQAESVKSSSEELAQGYTNLCFITGLFQLHKVAEKYRRLAQDVVQTLQQQHTTEFFLTRIGLYKVGAAQWDEAQRALEQSLEIAEYLGDRVKQVGVLAVLIRLCAYRGHFQQGTQLAVRLTGLARYLNNPAFETWGLNGEAYNLLLLGRLDEAIALLQTTLTVMATMKTTEEDPGAATQAILSKAYLRQGNISLAQQTAEAATPVLTSSVSARLGGFDDYEALAEVYFTLWGEDLVPAAHRPQVIQRARQAGKALSSYTRLFPFGRPRVHLYQGTYEWLTGKKAKAYKKWRKGLAIAEQLNMPYDQGLIHFEIGRRLPANDPARRQHLEQAGQYFAAVAAAYDLARVQRLLEGVHTV